MTRDLIDRLSKLDAPDREVDAEICIALQYVNQKGATNIRRDPYDEEFKDEWLDFEVDGELWTEKTPELTASVDAAIALAARVLPGWVFDNVGQDFHSVPGGYKAFGWTVELINGTRVQGQAPTFPLAICIALLRAKEAERD